MTILGHHTVVELRELLAAKDYTVSQMQKAYDAFESQWATRDPFAQSQWRDEWNAFKQRYNIARSKALVAIGAAKLVLAPDSTIPAESEYEGVLRALKKHADGPFEKGDLQDLHNRFVEAQHKPVAFPNLPQPSQGSDIDHSVFVHSDDALRQIDQASMNAKIEAKKATSDTNTKIAIGLGVAALGVGLYFGMPMALASAYRR